MGTCQTLVTEQEPDELEILPPPGHMQRTLRSVIRIQSVWRGYRLRRQLRISRVHVMSARLGPFDYGSGLKVQGVVRRVPMQVAEGVYTGEWNSYTRQREGRGVLDFTTGSRYEGYWKDDKPSGRGRMIYASGDVYEGEWMDGQCHGTGKLTYRDGYYEGSWAQGIRHGQGTEAYIDGSQYKGNFNRGHRQGNGRLQLADGSCYQGEFKKDLIDGSGTFVWRDLSSHTGLWHRGKRHGHGCFRAHDGRVFEGSYVEDKREGRGLLHLPDGSCISGIWKDDRILTEEDDKGPIDSEESQIRTTSSSQG